MKRSLALLSCVLLFTAVGESFAAPLSFSQSFTVLDAFGENPLSVQDAFIRAEPFAPGVHYWQPETPNVWGEA
jgi:hypothetical protein